MPRFYWSWLLLGCALVGCVRGHDPLTPSVDSETHFLYSCSAGCDDGLRCLCGVCTAACSADRECHAYAETARRTDSTSGHSQSCGAEAPTQICDVACARTADCASLGREHVCQQGWCRAEPVEQAKPSALTYANGGRRLKALYYVADGAAQFRGLHDQQLDIDCEFAPDSSGAGFHCVPKTVSEAIYLDAQCTEPAITIDSATGNPLLQDDWISVRTTGPETRCVGESPVPRDSYRIGARFFEGGLTSIGKPLPTVYASSGGKCAETPLQTARVAPDVNRLEPVDPALLVAGAVSTVDVGGGLALQRLVAEDDTQITLAVLGLGGMPCSLQQDGRCVPEPVATGSGGFYLDAQCKQPGFRISPIETCGRTPLGVRTIDAAVHVYELVLNESAFVPGTGGVDCNGLGPNMDVFRPGAEVTDRFPRATALQTGTGALRVTRFAVSNDASTTAGFVLDPGGAFVDAQGHACRVQPAVDGSLRCLPERSLVNEAEYWTNAACEERLFVGADPTVERSELRVVRWQESDYQSISALFSLTVHDGPVYQVVETQCVSAEPPPTPLLARGAELPLSTLPSVQASAL